jgi:MFS family permease
MGISQESQTTAIEDSAVMAVQVHSHRKAWYVVFVLTSIYMLSFVDRQILSLLVPWIKKDLGVSDTQIGLLQGFAFAIFYTLMGLPLGRMVDRRNRRNLVAVCIVIWSAFTSICAFAKSFLSLFLARIGVGIGEAGLSPAAYSLISDCFSKDRIGTAISVYYFGLYLGQSIAFIVGGIALDALAQTSVVTLPVLGAISSWRIIFLIVGIPGLLFALLACTIREPQRRNLILADDGKPLDASLREAYAQIALRWKSIAGISVGMVFQSGCNYAVSSWMPTYFFRIHNWTAGEAGRVLAIIMIVFACTGMYTGGILSDRWQKRGVSDAPLRVALISALGIMLFITPATLVSDARWTLILLAVGMFLLSFPMGTAVAAIQLIFPNQVRGQAAALFLFILNLGGMGLGPLLPGVLNDYLFKNENMIGVSLSLTVGVASFFMLVVFWATLSAYRVHYEMMERTRSI